MKKKKKTARRKTITPRCDVCRDHACSEGKDCFDLSDTYRERYKKDKALRAVAGAAAHVEAKHYGKATRLEEIAHFADRLGFTHLGMAFCAGFREEARVVGRLLRARFKVTSACCKIGAVPKKALGFPSVRAGKEESICNPVAQAEVLNRAGTELNIALGLCVGHDALFNRHSEAYVTTLVAKDRVLAHNPIGAITCPYVRRRLEEGIFAR